MCHTHMSRDNITRLHSKWQGVDSVCRAALKDVEPQPRGCLCCQKGSVAPCYPINSLCAAGWLSDKHLAWIFALWESSHLQPVTLHVSAKWNKIQILQHTRPAEPVILWALACCQISWGITLRCLHFSLERCMCTRVCAHMHTLITKDVLEDVLGLHDTLPMIALKQIIGTYSNICCFIAISKGCCFVFTVPLEVPQAAFHCRLVQHLHAAHTGARTGDLHSQDVVHVTGTFSDGHWGVGAEIQQTGAGARIVLPTSLSKSVGDRFLLTFTVAMLLPN